MVLTGTPGSRTGYLKVNNSSAGILWFRLRARQSNGLKATPSKGTLGPYEAVEVSEE